MIKRSEFDLLLQEKKMLDSEVLFESIINDKLDEYDFFISYSSKDKQYALLTKKLLEEMYIDCNRTGYTVYIDIYDQKLDPNVVSDDTAKRLANMIEKSKSIIYIHSQGSTLSKWCPWELGLGQGLNKPISIIELYDNDDYGRQTYLELYPTIKRNKIKGTNHYIFWVHDRKNNKKYIDIRNFIIGKKPSFH